MTDIISDEPTDGADSPFAIWIPAHSERFRVADRDLASIQAIAIHTIEGGTGDHVAEPLARSWQKADPNPKRNVASNYIADESTTVQCIREKDISFSAGHEGNVRTISIEAARHAADSRERWLEGTTLDRLANQCACIAFRGGPPLVKRSASEFRDGERGLVGHKDISDAFHESDHWDPGPNFPWDVLIERATATLEMMRANAADTDRPEA